MKYSPLLLFLICLILLGSTGGQETFSPKKLIQDYVFIPAGNEGDSIVPEFYISAIEITNKQYRDFTQDLIDSGATDKVKIAMVDSSQWGKMIPASLPFAHYYFRNSAYDEYPVVNVSRRAAELYCAWLTEKYNSTSKAKAHFALPTEIQWEYAAKGGNSKAIYPWPGNSLVYEKHGKFHGTNMCNYLVDSTKNARNFTLTNDTSIDITAPSHSYMPNTYDIYNMGGNVAEMISNENYTKGGSYLSHADKVLISAHEDADLSHGSPTIGFRPVMVFDSDKK